MGKIPKLQILSSLVVAAALMALMVVPVLAQLPVMSPFSGSLTIDAAAAPFGSQLRAYVDGAPAELAAPAVGNVSTLTTAGEYDIVIQTNATGKAVTFEVKKAGTTQWLAATSDPASPVTSYQPQTVDLVAGAGAAVPPTIVTQAATNIGDTTARTNYNLTDLGTATTVACHIELGLTAATDDWTSTPANRTTTGSFGVNWIGLEPDTTYYFRAVAEGDGTAYGNVLSFTTLEEGEEPPAETFAWWLYKTFIEPFM